MKFLEFITEEKREKDLFTIVNNRDGSVPLDGGKPVTTWAVSPEKALEQILYRMRTNPKPHDWRVINNRDDYQGITWAQYKQMETELETAHMTPSPSKFDKRDQQMTLFDDPNLTTPYGESVNGNIRFQDAPMSDKIDRISKYPYDNNKYYHVTSPDNVESIITKGIQGDEIWVTKGKPWKEYTNGSLIELELNSEDLVRDSRWNDEHGVFVSTKDIPPDSITKVFDWIDTINVREDILANQFSDRDRLNNDDIIKLLNRYGT